MLMLVNLAVDKRLNCRIFFVKWMVHVDTGKIERRPYAFIDGYVDVLRYKRKREQITNKKKGVHIRSWGQLTGPALPRTLLLHVSHYR